MLLHEATLSMGYQQLSLRMEDWLHVCTPYVCPYYWCTFCNQIYHVHAILLNIEWFKFLLHHLVEPRITDSIGMCQTFLHPVAGRSKRSGSWMVSGISYLLLLWWMSSVQNQFSTLPYHFVQEHIVNYCKLLNLLGLSYTKKVVGWIYIPDLLSRQIKIYIII